MKNHQNDIWRIFQMNKELSKEGHVWSKFGSGNRESLSKAARELRTKGKLNGRLNGISKPNSLNPTPIPSRVASPTPSMASASSEAEADGGAVGRETRRRLVEWWSKEYCASRMRLCVVGKGAANFNLESIKAELCYVDSLDYLADLVSTLFSPILNRGQDPLPMINDHPFGPNEMGVRNVLYYPITTTNNT
jgi:insulysin